MKKLTIFSSLFLLVFGLTIGITVGLNGEAQAALCSGTCKYTNQECKNDNPPACYQHVEGMNGFYNTDGICFFGSGFCPDVWIGCCDYNPGE